MKRQTILILHGWGRAKNAQTAYKKTIGLFEKKGYEVYAPDMPGFGEAANPKVPFKLENYAEYIRNFIKKHNIHAPILIGHSFGGRVAIKYITSNTTDVKALILCGVPGFTPVKKVKLFASLLIAKIGSLIFSLPGLSTLEEKIRSWFYYVIGARDFYRAEGTMRDTFKNIVREELKDMMEAIRIPTLLVWGDKDAIVPIHVATRMKNIIRNSKLLIIPDGKHSVIMDEPTIFVDDVHSFLQLI
jgi:pimeloyl-ACP methyl ester carboxylesterase